MQITLVSYNIHSGVGTDGKQDYARIGEFFARENTDVALLQEMDTRHPDRNIEDDIRHLCGDHFDYFIPAATLTTSDGWYGNAILSRYPLESTRVVDSSVHGRQPRNIQDVIMNIKGKQLRILNTHKGLKRFERRAQIAKLLGILDAIEEEKAIPLLVAGDFNEWQIFSKLLKSIDRQLQACRAKPTFPSQYPMLRLDRVWCRPKALVSRAERIFDERTKILSDHLPIKIELLLE